MADTQSRSETPHTGSFGESLITGLTPRDVHEFIKKLVALNTTLKSRLAAVNRDIAGRRGNADDASTEPVVHSPVQATGQSDSSPRADQSLLLPSTLTSILSYITPVQTESEVDEIIGPTLEDWHERFYVPRLESAPGAPANPQLDSYLRRELERRRTDYNELVGHHNMLLGLLRTNSQRHDEQKDDFRQQLTLLQDHARAACQERDQSRADAAEAQQRLQSEIEDLHTHIERHQENLQKLGQEKATLQQQVASLSTENRLLNNANNENTRLTTELDTLKKENQRLLATDSENTRIIAIINEELAKLKGDYSALKEDHTKAMREISSLSEQLKAVQESRDEELRLANEQLVKERERLEQDLNAARMRFEQLNSDTKSSSFEEQAKSMTQLKRKNRELELKLDELHKSKDVLQAMLEDSTSKLAEIELRGQLDDVRAMLKVCEDLARTRGETIENLKREHSRSIESSEAYRMLRQQCDMYKKSLDDERKNLEKESATVKELRQSIDTIQSTLNEITEERDSLRLITMRQRHNPPPDVRRSGSASDVNTVNSATAGAAAATLPPTFAQPHRLEVAADTGSPRARTGTRQSAVQTPANIRLPASTFRMGPPTIHRCQYCGAQHPDHDSRFVHEKDCPMRPFDD